MLGVRTAAVLGALGVVLALLQASGMVLPARPGDWHTTVAVHLTHAAAMLAVALYARASGRSVHLVCDLLGVGIVLFAGGQYGFAAGGPKELGLLSLLGGALLLGGWVAAFVQLGRPAGPSR